MTSACSIIAYPHMRSHWYEAHVRVGDDERMLDLSLADLIDGNESGDERKAARPGAWRRPPRRVVGFRRPHAGTREIGRGGDRGGPTSAVRGVPHPPLGVRL